MGPFWPFWGSILGPFLNSDPLLSLLVIFEALPVILQGTQIHIWRTWKTWKWPLFWAILDPLQDPQKWPIFGHFLDPFFEPLLAIFPYICNLFMEIGVSKKVSFLSHFLVISETASQKIVLRTHFDTLLAFFAFLWFWTLPHLIFLTDFWDIFHKWKMQKNDPAQNWVSLPLTLKPLFSVFFTSFMSVISGFESPVEWQVNPQKWRFSSFLQKEPKRGQSCQKVPFFIKIAKSAIFGTFWDFYQTRQNHSCRHCGEGFEISCLKMSFAQWLHEWFWRVWSKCQKSDILRSNLC